MYYDTWKFQKDVSVIHKNNDMIDDIKLRQDIFYVSEYSDAYRVINRKVTIVFLYVIYLLLTGNRNIQVRISLLEGFFDTQKFLVCSEWIMMSNKKLFGSHIPSIHDGLGKGAMSKFAT